MKLVGKEDSDRDGRYEHVVIYTETGRALRGMKDMDGDGIYEIRERYVDGALMEIEYDENADGRPDYREQGRGSRKEWDLNHDGIVDVIERRTPEGKVVWEYTGLLRGRRFE